nr:hypothetical protein [Tanacetum cinerariifolium]
MLMYVNKTYGLSRCMIGIHRSMYNSRGIDVGIIRGPRMGMSTPIDLTNVLALANLVNETQMQMQEGKVDMESSGTKLDEQDTNSRSGNDADTKDAVIRPVNVQEPLAKILNETSKKVKINKEIEVLETINIELEHNMANLLAENEKLHKENEHLKQTYKDHYDSIKKK